MSYQESLLGELEFSDLQEIFEEKDHELMEKRKVLENYLKERKFMALSIVQLASTFEAMAKEVAALAKEKTTLGEKLKSLRNEIIAIESFLVLNKQESELKQDGGSIDTHQLGEELQHLQAHMKTFQDMKIEREKRALEVMNELRKNENDLEAVRNRALVLQKILFQESAQLASKSQQIHQLKRIIGQIHARIKTESCSLDRLLQQRIAARNKPKPPVFQVWLLYSLL